MFTLPKRIFFIKFLPLFLILSFYVNNLQAQTSLLTDLLEIDENFKLTDIEYSQFGYNLKSGDLNNDGITDLIIGAPSSPSITQGHPGSGRVHIYFGQSDTTYTIQSSLKLFLDLQDTEDDEFVTLGSTMGIGDINNDGIDDLLLSDIGYENKKGVVYVVFGKSNLNDIQEINLKNLNINSGRKFIGSKDANFVYPSKLGQSMSVGDINNDGYNDLLVTETSTYTYAIYHTAFENHFTINLDTLTAVSGIVIKTPNSPKNSLIADVTNDNINEVILGDGDVYVVFGQTISSFDTLKVSEINLTTGIKITGDSYKNLGSALTIGDINNDGISDLVIGDFNYVDYTSGVGRTYNGSIHIVFGGEFAYTSNIYAPSLHEEQGFSIVGPDNHNIGSNLAVADFNNDGFDDIVTGGRKNKIFGFYGSNTLYSEMIYLTENGFINGFTINLNYESEYINYRGITALDINNDNNIDLAFGITESTFDKFTEAYLLTDLSSIIGAGTPPPIHTFPAGDGSSENPYQIFTASQLDSIRYFPQANFIQMANIDFSNYYYGDSSGWTPIGEDEPNHSVNSFAFKGSFNGNGFEIQNLTINENHPNIGLFSVLEGTVENVLLNNIIILDKTFSSINNDTLGTIGGIAGKVNLTGVIKNSSVEGSINLTHRTLPYVGLIAGSNSGIISSTTSFGTITDKNQKLTGGGVTGINSGFIDNSSSYARLSLAKAGGISGKNSGFITQSFFSGSIASTLVAGGIVGESASQDGFSTSINNSYSYSTLNAPTMGGIIGVDSGFVLLISNYSASNYIIEDSTLLRGLGGIIGSIALDDTSLAFPLYQLNYWNTELANQPSNLFKDNIGIKITTNEMKQQASFQDWDFEDIWEIEEWNSFPYLKENPPQTLPGVDILTGIESIESTPTKFQINQNYPNPFNPTTNISFSLSEPTKVSLRIFDAMGRTVSTLISSKIMPVGTHNITFNGTNLASGVYFYQIVAGNKPHIMKMTLVK